MFIAIIVCSAFVVLALIFGITFLSYHHLDHARRVKGMDIASDQKKDEFEFIKSVLPEQAAQHLLTGEAPTPAQRVEQRAKPHYQ